MLRTEQTFIIENIAEFKSNLLAWAQQYNKAIWLDSNNPNNNNSNYNLSDFDAVLAVDAYSELKCDSSQSFKKLKEYQENLEDYIFGYLSYDLKNDVEKLTSNNFDGLHFPDLFFFQPKKIFFIKEDSVTVKYMSTFSDEIEFDIANIKSFNSKKDTTLESEIKIKLRIHKDEYHNKLDTILNHIHRGDIYEVSFCQEFYAEDSEINPVKVYQNLNKISSSPFATFLKLDDKFLLSASPERFLKRNKNSIISQPIKGTIKRGENKAEDEKLKNQLTNDLKERAENIMIVDLVRNDLSRTAIKGSVRVAELCKVYSFKQVHQLISTVVSEIKPETNSVDIIKSLFPMGSMTGAPKIAAMKIIEDLEETKRGLFSGAVGYFSPTGDFDFNVIIRSILYNASNKYVSYSVGGAITSKSKIEKEYEECLLKAKAMRQVLLQPN
ncbi:MAG: aminodeoxychorismate synthase component I [Urechidicola sp.]|nr:aminodeoxychorismate synthase component I [Urechidicola sp.]